jgi:hypothetical protein
MDFGCQILIMLTKEEKHGQDFILSCTMRACNLTWTVLIVQALFVPSIAPEAWKT